MGTWSEAFYEHNHIPAGFSEINIPLRKVMEGLVLQTFRVR